ncbi:hypothetical protein KIL84_016455 [Mauremys mutica]|uniref:Uncharacterized protein n=1 Tax=Mauremys mutica TaxID=74926 RepID=A0A9D3X4A5_9SAUR|nr:hypothetical protein KIL84_016455 [Mauremys mutica]
MCSAYISRAQSCRPPEGNEQPNSCSIWAYTENFLPLSAESSECYRQTLSFCVVCRTCRFFQSCRKGLLLKKYRNTLLSSARLPPQDRLNISTPAKRFCDQNLAG